ncbi:hypothetical protein B0I37DRAFT_164909 [Chaetomium sp. MPI-CAGE-AT-0009]|nr:hypothetical protein B0I37DRAFT_164909 [Chaetomium sp. MPI-CAGE-AT-0009]
MSASGVAAAINPNGPEGQQIHLFYNTNTKNLGFQFFDETKHSDVTEAFAAGVDGVTGFILNPAQVATTNLTGVNVVVGFTNKPKPAAAEGCKCDDPTQNDISIISPVYQPLTATDLTNLTIAATSSDTTAYVYYLTGTDAASTTINEYTIGDDSPGQFDDTSKILPQSSLAAFYVPETELRYVIYQANKTKRLHCYCPVAGSIDGELLPLSFCSFWGRFCLPQSYHCGYLILLDTLYYTSTQLILFGRCTDPEIDGTGDAKANTPLAAVYVSGKAYLYYVDGSDSVRAVVWDGKKWGSSRAVSHAPSQVDEGSQLTVVPSPAGNHIFYVGAGQSKHFKFSHGIDKI